MTVIQRVVLAAGIGFLPPFAHADFGRKIVQLDLARQMETTTFVSNYIDRVAALGFDTLQLYLEARVATKTFLRPAGEHYTGEQMKGIVAHAAEKGLVVVPVVSLLGHAEQFFRQPGYDSYAEDPEENGRIGNEKYIFCHSNPETRVFLRNYLTELCEIFTGPYFHAGFDEAWNAGTCPKCREKELRDELFSDCVLWAHDTLAGLGKRLWMWDDFFDFHPKAFCRMPKDIVMCHWNYDTDISDRGGRMNFAGRMRNDRLLEYERLGFDVIPCCWYRPDNIRTMVAYARRHRTFGFLFTQWEELIDNFHGGSLPRIVAGKILLDNPSGALLDDPFLAACRRVFPSLTPTEARAAADLLSEPANELAVMLLRASALKPSQGAVEGDPFAERALLDDLVMRGEIAVCQKKAAPAFAALEDPRRTSAEVARARDVLRGIQPEIDRLVQRRQEQKRLWRPGCGACESVRPAETLAERIRKAVSSTAVATADEKLLEVELTLVDGYGVPWWKAFGRFGGEWREIAAGVWKDPEMKAAFTVRATFRSETMPEAVRLEQHGFGEAFLRYVSVADRAGRCVPAAVTATSGRVKDAANVLTDDYSVATFGAFGYLDAF